jgi:hypothetical protein
MLFAGDRHNPGHNQCFFCGAGCDDTYQAADYIKNTFTNYDGVASPGSKYACCGCTLAMGWGEDEIGLIDGTVKVRENPRGMAPRLYSWLLTANKRIAFTKAHIPLIRDILCRNPPEPPFAVILADSGQKHLIFRTPVAMSRDMFPVMLEEEIILVSPALLEERIAITTPVVAATGKPALKESVTAGTFIAYYQYHGNTDALETWQMVQGQPLSRLAAWLAKNKEEAQIDPAVKRD